MNFKKLMLFMLQLLRILPVQLSAQPGINEFAQVTSEVSSWYLRLFDLLLAFGATCGLLGGLRVYNNWQSGKHHIDAQVIGWLMSCLFLSLIWGALRALYGINY